MSTGKSKEEILKELDEKHFEVMTSNVSTWEKFKSFRSLGLRGMWRNYGAALLVTYGSIAIVSFGSCYVVVQMNEQAIYDFLLSHNLQPYIKIVEDYCNSGLEYCGIENIFGSNIKENPKAVMNLVLAITLHEALEEVRLIPLIVLVPKVAILLKRLK
jgi:hypothetical protein